MIQRLQLTSLIRCCFSITTKRSQCTSVPSLIMDKMMEATHSASQPPPLHSPVKTEETEHPMNTLGTPIGYIKSCFKSKNGTPRQPSVCTFSRAKLTILKAAFPNPQHCIQGLDKFSHVWILFVFHKNGGGKFTKAKVKPPRLDGAKVGVFSTRSPHRPNPIGLTLAKLDRIQGDTLHLSGVDIIEGTPVLDIKPYVPSYDNPCSIQHGQTSSVMSDQENISPETLKDSAAISSTPSTKANAEGNLHQHHDNSDSDELVQTVNLQNAGFDAGVTRVNEEIVSAGIERAAEQVDTVCKSGDLAHADCKEQDRKVPPTSRTSQKHSDGSQNTTHSENRKSLQCVHETDNRSDALLPSQSDEYSLPGSKVAVADWIQHPPITKLTVRFTEHAAADLRRFKTSSIDSPHHLEFLQSEQEARSAICEILQADPRSTYRRNNCQDRLYFFTVDTLHVTCWFGADFVEVVRVQPVSLADVPKH
ncbi:tRNA (adenine(37)-N6)-methyltransferase-like [Asterias amurensis]|uniref:tRNA (adenine(37)-N6)-methyltransferase-like n=1 Tax=Asterias amurensis TaxID=7602 RepID=UPI003AB3FEC2